MSSVTRCYVQNELHVGESISLDSATAHRLLHVMRLQAGDTVILFNGDGNDYTAELTALTKKSAQASINEKTTRHTESNLKIHLGQGISKGERMDYTIQKCAEIGCSEITPLFTERCNVKLSGERLEKRVAHWQQVAISACEQSGRTAIPIIHTPLKLSNWLGQTHTQGFICDTDAQYAIDHYQPPTDPVSLLVGPEGGMSEEEIQLALQVGFKQLYLGPRILRTETAGLVAMSLMQAKWGDLK